jgi:hypothetical protein
MIYKLWLQYFLFMRLLYKKKSDDRNVNAQVLGFLCLFFICMFLEVLCELTFGYRLLFNLFGKGLPLSLYASLATFIILLPIFIIFNRKVIDNKILVFRNALNKAGKIKRYFVILYLLLCCALFVISGVIIYFNSPPPASL